MGRDNQSRTNHAYDDEPRDCDRRGGCDRSDHFSLQPAAAGSRHGNDVAAAAAFAAVFGTIAAIIAAEQYRDRPSYGPSYGPGYTHGPAYRGHGPQGGWQHHRRW